MILNLPNFKHLSVFELRPENWWEADLLIEIICFFIILFLYHLFCFTMERFEWIAISDQKKKDLFSFYLNSERKSNLPIHLINSLRLYNNNLNTCVETFKLSTSNGKNHLEIDHGWKDLSIPSTWLKIC